MPLTPISVGLFPDVPIAAGVPAVLRPPGLPEVLPALLIGDAFSILNSFSGAQQWGIFDQGGGAVLTGDTVSAFDFRRESRISDYPVERGGFASYNKVAVPGDVRLTFTQGGSVGERSGFLEAVQTAAASMDLYDAIMPEKTFTSMNIVHFDCRREARAGATLLTVEVWLVEVRVTGASQFTNTKTADGANAQNDGSVQAQDPTGAQLAGATAPVATGGAGSFANQDSPLAATLTPPSHGPETSFSGNAPPGTDPSAVAPRPTVTITDVTDIPMTQLMSLQ